MLREAPAGEFSIDLAAFIAQEHEEQRWLIPGLLPEACLILLAGTPKAGKTFLAQAMLAAISTGTPFLGRACQQGRVLYVLEEGHPASVAERFRHALEVRGGDGRGSRLALRRGLKVDVNDSWAELRATVRQHRPLLTVLDPFVKLHGAEENSAKEIAPIMERVQALTELGTAVLLVHHVGKKGEGFSSSSGAARGSSAIISSTDGNLILTKRPRIDQETRALRLATEMRDAEDETIEIAWRPKFASFDVASCADQPEGSKAPGGITGNVILEVLTAELASGAMGLTVKRLAEVRQVSNETARKALELAAGEKIVIGRMVSRRLVYTPAQTA